MLVRKETRLSKSSQVNSITIGLNHSNSLKVLQPINEAHMFMTPPNPGTQWNPWAITLAKDTLNNNQSSVLKDVDKILLNTI